MANPFADPLLEKIKKNKKRQFNLPSEAPKKKEEFAGTFTDVKSGKISGVRTPTGQVYFGINKDDLAQLQKTYPLPMVTEGQTQRVATIGEQAKAQAEVEAQKAAIMGEAPALRELSPEAGPTENIPLIGPGIAAVGSAIGETLFPGRMKNISPEQLRTQEATEIEAQVYDEGLTASQTFGVFVESIGAGKINRWIGGLLQTPSDDVKTILTNLETETARASDYANWGKQNIISKETALKNINEIDLNIQRLESKIKYLINFSAELRANPENVNVIETKILQARQDLLNFKLVSQGLA